MARQALLIAGLVILYNPSPLGGCGQRDRAPIVLGPTTLDHRLADQPVDGGGHGRGGNAQISSDIAQTTSGMLADEQQRLRVERIQSVVGRRSRFGDLEAAGEPLEGARKLFYLL